MRFFIEEAKDQPGIFFIGYFKRKWFFNVKEYHENYVRYSSAWSKVEYKSLEEAEQALEVWAGQVKEWLEEERIKKARYNQPRERRVLEY